MYTSIFLIQYSGDQASLGQLGEAPGGWKKANANPTLKKG